MKREKSVKFADQEELTEGFDDPHLRSKFIRKTFTILMLQLLLTFGSIIIVHYFFQFKVLDFIRQHMYLLWISVGVTIFISLILACFPLIGRKSPFNYLVLIMFTVALAFMVVFISVLSQRELVMMCIGITFGISAVITIAACISKIDITSWWFLMFLLGLALVGLGIAAIFVKSRTYHIIYASIALCIYILFLFYDVQLMLGGKHRVAFGTDDHVLAALSLYMDIVGIFIHLVKLLNAVKE